jgi:preprotein translocase subunit YajC
MEQIAKDAEARIQTKSMKVGDRVVNRMAGLPDAHGTVAAVDGEWVGVRMDDDGTVWAWHYRSLEPSDTVAQHIAEASE